MFFIGNPSNILAMGLIFLSPVYIGILRDWLVERRVYLVYVIGLAVLALMPLRMVVVDLPAWRSFTDWLTEFVGQPPGAKLHFNARIVWGLLTCYDIKAAAMGQFDTILDRGSDLQY